MKKCIAPIILLVSMVITGIISQTLASQLLDTEHAFDYSSRNVCDDRFVGVKESSQNLNVTKFIDDCCEKDEVIRTTEKKGILAIKVRTGFIANEGFINIISLFSDAGCLKDLQVLDLSYNRANAEIFSNSEFTKNLELLLGRKEFKFFDICGNYAASIDVKNYFSTLDMLKLEKIIWIHKGHLNSLNWVTVVDGKKTDEVRKIKSKHSEYYDLKIQYNVNFSTKFDNMENITKDNIIISKYSWKDILNTINPKQEDSDSPLKYLIDFALDDKYPQERDQSRLEIAKKIQYPFSNKEQIPSMAARIFYTLANDDDVLEITRGEAAYYLADIRRNGTGLPYNIEESNKLFDMAKEFGYHDINQPE